jgi:SAM-dependent methyltransferase
MSWRPCVVGGAWVTVILAPAMASVSMERWQEAQEAEQRFWLKKNGRMRRFCRSLQGSIATAEWVHPDAPAGDWLAVGLGPLGISCTHFLPGAEALHALDPLEPLPAEEWDLPDPCKALLRACEEKTTKHVGKGERMDFPDDAFAFVSMENMLDHVQDPAAVVREARRVVQPGGCLLVTVDTFSLIGNTRYRLASRRLSRSTFVRAHPHRFSSNEVVSTVAGAGFEIVRSDMPSRMDAIAGRHFRLRLLAR